MLSYYLILCAKVRKNCVGWCMKGPRNAFLRQKKIIAAIIALPIWRCGFLPMSFGFSGQGTMCLAV